MNMNQDVVVAVVIGIVVGLIGALVIRWLKVLVSRATAAKQQEPALAKVKRSYKRKITADGVAVTAIKSSKTPKKQCGRRAETKSSAKKMRSTAGGVDSIKKRPGRPTNAVLAARQALTAKLVENNTKAVSASTKNPATADHQLLLEKLINLSPAPMLWRLCLSEGPLFY